MHGRHELARALCACTGFKALPLSRPGRRCRRPACRPDRRPAGEGGRGAARRGGMTPGRSALGPAAHLPALREGAPHPSMHSARAQPTLSSLAAVAARDSRVALSAEAMAAFTSLCRGGPGEWERGGSGRGRQRAAGRRARLPTHRPGGAQAEPLRPAHVNDVLHVVANVLAVHIHLREARPGAVSRRGRAPGAWGRAPPPFGHPRLHWQASHMSGALCCCCWPYCWWPHTHGARLHAAQQSTGEHSRAPSP